VLRSFHFWRSRTSEQKQTAAGAWLTATVTYGLRSARPLKKLALDNCISSAGRIATVLRQFSDDEMRR